MKSVPPRGSGWAKCRLPISNCSSPHCQSAFGNRQSAMRFTHPLPRGGTDFIAYRARFCIRYLERAVVGLHRGSCLFNCLLAGRRQCWFGLRVIGQSLPTASPLLDGRLVLSASNFRDLAGDAGVVGGYEIVTFRYSDFISEGRGSWRSRRRARCDWS